MIIEIGITAYIQNDLSAYKDSSVRYFTDAEVAQVYRNYLQQKVQREMPNGSVYWYEIETTESFDADEAIKQDALAKLTYQEKQALGLE